MTRSEAKVEHSSCDVLVIGGGIAGLTAAAGAARHWDVCLITKGTLEETTTFFAQGGIAAALGPYDSAELHFADTLEAGAGLCDEEAVRILVEEGPERVRELERLGTAFDRREGELVLGKEGAHSVARVVHAGGDATGSVVASALAEAIVSGSRAKLRENEFVIDLLTEGGRCVGAISLGKEGELAVTRARAVVLACGGAGQVFWTTTNPPVSTGDGHAMAYRAGALLRDMEFMQFHPTALYSAENPTLLLTEALRGEGAYLIDGEGRRFMVGAHPRAELAPRDVVVGEMEKVMARQGIDHVWLDARHLDPDFLHQRFPTVCSGLQQRGLDLSHELIPIAPASHYFIGGVVTDTWAQSSLPGLYACGETASTGIHGANRLASNSLLEGLVFGERAARSIDRYLTSSAPRTSPVSPVHFAYEAGQRAGNSPELVSDCRAQLRRLMTDYCGVVRSGERLEKARRVLRELRSALRPPRPTVADWELYNLLTVAEQMVEAAILREESRGVHLRRDFPVRDDVHWRRHILVQRDPQTGRPVMRLSEPKRGAGGEG